MAIDKSTVNINFGQGLDTKTDKKQVSLGRFLRLQNSIFTKGGLLQKRNGYGELSPLPDATSTATATFNDNLLAIGANINAYSAGSAMWVNKGAIKDVDLSTMPLIRTNTNQSQADSAVSANGFVCTVYTDNVTSGSSTVASYKYVIADSVTGQNIIAPAVITPATGTVTGSPRVFLLGTYFVIVFTNNISGTYHLQYIAINTTVPTSVTANINITSQYTPASTVNFDGYVINNALFLAWNGSDGGGAIRVTSIDHTLAQHGTVAFTGKVATLMSVTADATGSSPVVYVSFYDLPSTAGYVLAVDQNLNTVHAPTQIISSGTVLNITATAQNRICTFLYEVSNAYSYDSGIATNFVKKNTITQAGVVGTANTLVRSVGLASKAFLIDSVMYALMIYTSSYQPTYFLINDTGNIVSRFAYQNAGGYYTLGLPGVAITGNLAQIAYLFKNQIQAVNKNTDVPTGTQTAGIYSQLGVNLVNLTIGDNQISTAEIGNNLNITGGFLKAYDGYQATEQGFHLYPDSIEATWSATGGHIAAQPDGATNANAYFYQVTYEWSDNQGNIFRSAPSIPISVTTTGNGVIGSVAINVPTLRLTAKTANPVKIVIYRWSVAQQAYYQITSINVPLMNSLTVDSVSYTDTLADATILGNNLIYTTGGVLENVGAPATSILTLFQTRLFLVDAEDQNLLWLSKQVIEATPVEMSDLLTIFIPPTLGVSGSTGPMRALSAMDDKLIIFKKNAIYYINGSGPDNTGGNSQYSDPIFVTSAVGCDNPQSIILMPNGLMFQSDKGIWLLGRDLSTKYIGSEVEDFTQNASVLSAISVPGTNQIRFTLSSGITLMYDYFYGQWGTFANIPAVSSTVYQGMHTYINSFGQVFQETPNKYLDGSSPVLMSFTTSWINLAGLQGYQRAYFFYLLGTYISPHKLYLNIAYDYNDSASQSSVIHPDNFAAAYGGEQFWGSGNTWGGNGDLEDWRVFLQTQKCKAFNITMNEVFDASFGTVAGAGLTLSGLDLVVGIKKGYAPRPASNSTG